MRGAGAGLVHRLQVARLAQLLLAQLGDVELAEQLAEQMQVPLQRGSEAIAREDAELELPVGELHDVRRAAAEFAARRAAVPGDARHRGQLAQRGHRLLEEALRARLLLRELRQHLQPALDRRRKPEFPIKDR